MLSCFVLNHNLRFVFVLHLVVSLLLFLFLLLSYFVIFGILATSQNISGKKHGNSENPPNQKCRKKKNGHLRQEQLAQVCSQNRVFGVSFTFCSFAENTIK